MKTKTKTLYVVYCDSNSTSDEFINAANEVKKAVEDAQDRGYSVIALPNTYSLTTLILD